MMVQGKAERADRNEGRLLYYNTYVMERIHGISLFVVANGLFEAILSAIDSSHSFGAERISHVRASFQFLPYVPRIDDSHDEATKASSTQHDYADGIAWMLHFSQSSPHASTAASRLFVDLPLWRRPRV